MENNGFYVSELLVKGQGKKDALVSFQRGLNIISGASDTGKSYIFACIEFMLGREESPKPIPESVGYTDIYIELRNINNDAPISIHRKFQESNVQYKRCSLKDYQRSSVDISSVPVRHNSKNESNLSRLLLKECNLDEKQLKVSKENKKVSLTFTDIRKLTCIHEERIITEESPFYYDSQYHLQTKNQSFIKFLLTGNDDSELKTEEKTEITETKLKSKIELLKDQLEFKYDSLRNLAEQLEGITTVMAESEINELNLSLLQTNSELESLGKKRNVLFSDIQKATNLLSQKNELKNRFELLENHYNSDLNRLKFVQEGGQFLSQLDNQICPVCFQKIDEEHEHQIIENTKIVDAVEAESHKISKKLTNLKDTIKELNETISTLSSELNLSKTRYQFLQSKINEELNPKSDFIKSRLFKIVEYEKSQAKKNVLEDEIQEIEARILEFEDDLSNTSKGTKPSVRIPKLHTDKLSFFIQKRLQAWKYDDNVNTFFDGSYSIFDIQIGGKLRKSYGKGKRGVSYAASIIGLSDFCASFNRSFSACIVLDSPLTAYESNKQNKNNELGTDIVSSFYNDLSLIGSNRQLIILDNKKPDENLKGEFNHTEFSGQKGVGRPGFFPQ